MRPLSGPVLRDTARLSQRYPPSLRAMGFLVSQHGQLGAIPPPPFLSVSPLGEQVKWRRDTPPRKGYLSDTCAIPYKNKANRCDTPLCDTISKGYCAIWGGVSRTGLLSEARATYPPAQNQYMQEKNLGELIFAWTHAGPVLALARIQENILEESFSAKQPNSWGNSFRCEYCIIHVAPVFAPAQIQEKFLANYLCIGFVPGGTYRCGESKSSLALCFAIAPQVWPLLLHLHLHGLLLQVRHSVPPL